MKKLLFLMSLLLPTIASAESLTLKYDGYWEGIQAGSLTLKNTESSGSYHTITDVKTTGIVKTLTNFYSYSITNGKIIGNTYKPSQYDCEWQTKKGKQHIIVNYAPNGEVSEDATPPENRKKRPEVTQSYKENSADPISTVFNARNQLRHIIESQKPLPQKFQIKVFDSRRVFTANFLIAGYETKKLNGSNQKLLHITLDRSAVAGFTNKELEKLKNFNPVFDLYLDSDYIPVLGYGQAVIGRTEMRLANNCKGENCN